MILTVTLNFALDVTYGVDRLRPGTTARVKLLGRQAGGKGVNVARVLQALGREVVVTGFAGGLHGEAARAELAHAGLADATVPVAGESRQTIIVVDRSGAATGFSEPGAEISPSEWAALLARYRELAADAEGIVLAGSLPRGLAHNPYGELVAAAPPGVPLLLDADSDALRAALAAEPPLVKINHHELAEATGARDIVAGARMLRDAGAGCVVISAGADGLVCLDEETITRAAPPEALRGNPTGAGDAASAAIIAALVDGRRVPDALADAAALSAAAVAAPLAGHFDADLYGRLRDEITTG